MLDFPCYGIPHPLPKDDLTWGEPLCAPMRLFSAYTLQVNDHRTAHILMSSGRSSRPANKSFIEKLLAEAVEFVHHTDSVTRRALELEKNGIMGMDALHVACAEEAEADYFVSCDNVLVKKLRGQGNYTELREEMFAGQTVHDILDDMAKEAKSAWSLQEKTNHCRTQSSGCLELAEREED